MDVRCRVIAVLVLVAAATFLARSFDSSRFRPALPVARSACPVTVITASGYDSRRLTTSASFVFSPGLMTLLPIEK